MDLSAVEWLTELKCSDVAVRIVFVVFFKVDVVSYISHMFSKTVVDLSRGITDVGRLKFEADDL